MVHIDTGELIRQVVDEDTWRSWDAPVTDPDVDPDYRRRLSAARDATGTDESVTTGSARVGERPVAVIAGDFAFLAGSIGRVAATRIVAAFERATALGLPVLGLPTSGGTRMQEGTPAFLLMAAIAAAVQRHRDSGLPYLVYLRHPTTGGVLASWGSLGDVAHGEPGALVAFLGPRIYEGLYGRPFPPDVQTTESLAESGVIDGVCEPEAWRGIVAEILTVWHAREAGSRTQLGWEPAESRPGLLGARSSRLHPPGEAITGWEAVSATRAADRPGLWQLLESLETCVLLSGTQSGETATATILALALVDGLGVVVVGQDRSAQLHGLLIGPADLRVARRGMELAQRWGLPLLTVVDTQGGELSEAAERGALAGEIARCLATLAGLGTPTMSLLLGGGAGGAALALLPADRVIAVADGWVTPLPPEGASLIRHRTVDRAHHMADSQSITAADLHRVGAVDRVIEPPKPDLADVVAAVAEELARLSDGSVDLGARAGKWAGIGDRPFD